MATFNELDLTIECLNTSPVILWQPVAVGVDILVSGEHQCAPVSGMVQSQSVAELMRGHQQQIYT